MLGRSRWIRAAAAIASLALVAAACGGNGGDGVSAEGEVESADQELPFEIAEPSQAALDRARRAIDLLGGFSAAFVGVLLAVDGGYNTDQIFEGIDSGGFQRDGTILGTSGELVAPDGIEGGLIERALGGVEFIVFTGRAGDLTDEEVDGLSDEELEREFDDVYGDLDIPTVEEVARSIEVAMRAEFPLDEDLPIVVLARILEAIDDDVRKEELIFMAVTGRYSDDHLYAEAFRKCLTSPGVADSQGMVVKSAMDGCLDRRSPGLRERVEARRQASEAAEQQASEANSDEATVDEPGGEQALADGSYFGAFDYDYSLFWSIAPNNLHDSRDTVEENSAELVVSNGEVQLLTGAVLTNFPEQIFNNALACGTNSAFDLTGDPATAAMVDGNITLAVEITATRVGYGGNEYSDCTTLDWEVSAAVTATITTTADEVRVSLINPDGGHELSAVLTAG